MTGEQDCTGYLPIDDYALIGNCRTAALISRHGSIDWYCPGRFDSPAVFCKLLDAGQGGSFSVSPLADVAPNRCYVAGTPILETTYRDSDIEVRVTDFMPMHPRAAQEETDAQSATSRIVRRIEGISGEVDLAICFTPRCTYGSAVPTFEWIEGKGLLVDCSDVWLGLQCPDVRLEQRGEGAWEGNVHVGVGDCFDLTLVDAPDKEGVLATMSGDGEEDELDSTRRFWKEWTDRCTYGGPYRDDVVRGAITLKLLTYDPTGALVAAPTTSLPEQIGGSRNWDYRYTWLRDSSLILYALLTVGYNDEATRFLHWIQGVVGHHLSQNPQIMYTIDGDAHIPERELKHLEGYCGSRPVRIGNAASGQLQLDIYGEILTAAYIHYHQPESGGMRVPLPGQGRRPDDVTWSVLRALVDDAARLWKEPDSGIWEVRGGPQHFLYSKLMCWAAVDRGIRLAQEHDLQADVDRWQGVRDEIRTAIEHQGWNEELGTFVQAFGSRALDASVLAIPRVGFLPATDRRVLSTIDCIQRDLTHDGQVYRYRSEDGLPGGEGAFLLCTFWLVDALSLAGRLQDARQLFEHALHFHNDLGLFSEEIDPRTGAFLGNFPQGFTHLSLIRAAVGLARTDKHGAEEQPETEAQRAGHARTAAEEKFG